MKNWRGPVALLSVGAALGWFAHGLLATPGDEDVAHSAAVTPIVPAQTENTSTPVRAAEEEASPLRSYFDSGRYEEAVHWLAQARSGAERQPSPDEDAQVLREHVSALSATGQVGEAQALLAQIIAALPAFVEARLLLAQLELGEARYEDSVDTLYTGRLHVATLEELQRLETAIEQTIAAAHKQFLACCDAKRRIVFYQHVVALDPSRAASQLSLAQAFADDGQIGAARQALALVMYDPEVAAKARSLLGSLAGRTSSGTKIPLQRSGNQYHLTATFNDRVELRLLLDTGASMTVLSSAAFAALRSAATPLGERVLMTANGTVSAPVYRVASVAVGGRRVSNLEIAVVDQLDGGGLVGLLGMDYLDNFQYSLDRQDDALYLM